MPQPENALQKNDEKHSNWMTAMRLVRWLLTSPRQARRLVQWVILGALVTSALGTVANRLFSGTTADQDQRKPRPTPPEETWNGHQSNWWSGSETTNEVPSNRPGKTANKPIATGSNTVSTGPTTSPTSLPHFSMGAVFLRDNPAPIGPTAAPKYYAFAGPAWMNIAPLATATRPSTNPSGSSSEFGKSSKKGQSVSQSANLETTWTTGTTNQDPKSKGESSGNSIGVQKPATGEAGFAANHGLLPGGGELFLKTSRTAGISKSSQPTYALLGLSTGSTPQSSAVQVASTESEDLHFSLTGALTTVPTLGITEGTPVTNVTPEPATGVMMLAGAAMLLSRRRRQRVS
ncbi:MAG TPA: PEP-CTERM sorting domain-containing protein [Chthoniobacter sp.]